MTIEVWSDLICAMALDHKPTQKYVMQQCAFKKELHEAAHWLKYFGIPEQYVPKYVRRLIGSNLRMESKRNLDQEFYQLKITPSSIIDNNERFKVMLEHLNGQNSVSHKPHWM